MSGGNLDDCTVLSRNRVAYAIVGWQIGDWLPIARFVKTPFNNSGAIAANR